MLDRLQSTLESFGKNTLGLKEVQTPETFIATLRKGIAKAVAGRSDGILLNFCSPEHVKEIINSLGDARRGLIVACYLKIFYSRKKETADKMLVEEFASYDQNPSYHKMFELAGVADEITRTKLALERGENVRPAEKLLRISLANPTKRELKAYVSSFRESGVDLPCLYPYFESREDEAFKLNQVQEMIRF